MVKCPCKAANLKYECGTNFCTRDKVACDGLTIFKKSIIEDEFNMTKFGSCHNDNLILKN